MVILGLDTAWTSEGPSGVALVARKSGAWKCLCAAPSYDAFVRVASGVGVDWRHGRFRGTAPNIAELLAAARAKAGERVAAVAIDMPLSRRAFSGRRAADDAISAAFGGKGCSAHSPSAGRPGQIATTIAQDLAEAGYSLATAETTVGALPIAIEVYPHPALLVLLNSPYRVPYKAGKSNRYWPGTKVQERIANLLQQFALIEGALRRIFGDTHIPLPLPSEVATLSQLKRYEDALDALVCAWVGVGYIEGSASAYGDGAAAIWVPSSRTVRICPRKRIACRPALL